MRNARRRLEPKADAHKFRCTAEGTVLTPCHPVGQVLVVGERWEARCDEGADPGEKVRVVGIEGLTLTVEKVA